jgi:inhibitor of growth protein 4
MINQTRQQTNYCLGLASQSLRKGNGSIYNCYNTNNNEEDEAVEKMRKDIEANQDSALSLCTEKVLLARHAYDLVSFFYSKAFLINCFLQHLKLMLYGAC